MSSGAPFPTKILLVIVFIAVEIGVLLRPTDRASTTAKPDGES